MLQPPILAGEGEILPRYVFLESFLSGSHVLEVGAVRATGGRSARFLREKGAATVLALDDDAKAVARAAADPALSIVGTEFRVGDPRDVSGVSFDLIVLHRPGPLVSEPVRIASLKRLLSETGRLVIALPHAEGLSLEDLARKEKTAAGPGHSELAALLQGVFRSVELATQTVFFGYSIAPANAQDPETSLDESLSDTSPPAYHLFICGSQPSGLNAVSLTPLSAAVIRELVGRPEATGAAHQGKDLLGLDEELESEQQSERVRELEARCQTALEQAQLAELTTAQALAERDHLKSKLRARSGEGDEGSGELAAVTQSLAKAREEVERLTGEQASAEQRLTEERAGLLSQLAETEKARAAAEERAAAAEAARVEAAE
ncbi:MAG: methyltransferase domain-containing protein, partial [Myxococcaceae bacterium]